MTDQGLDAIVRVSPGDFKVDVIPMPAGIAGEAVHTGVFDHDGILWFTGQRGIVARMEPAPPSVPEDTLLRDTVKRGSIVRQERGLGTLVPEDTRWIPATTEGRVERITRLAGLYQQAFPQSAGSDGAAGASPAIAAMGQALQEAEFALNTDRQLAQAFGQSGRVVLPMVFQLGEPRGNPDRPLPDFATRHRLASVGGDGAAPAAQAVDLPIDAIGQHEAAWIPQDVLRIRQIQGLAILHERQRLVAHQAGERRALQHPIAWRDGVDRREEP